MASSVLLTNVAQQSAEWKDKERRFNDKIKVLKSENKKLVNLLKESEQMFATKLEDAKKESQNLSNMFKQLWPKIKHLVKDPAELLRTSGLKLSQSELSCHEAKHEETIEQLQKQVVAHKQRELELKAEIQHQNERNLRNEHKKKSLQRKNREMKAFTSTVRSYFGSKSTASTCSERSLKPNLPAKPGLNADFQEPTPAFLKATQFNYSLEESEEEFSENYPPAGTDYEIEDLMIQDRLEKKRSQ